MVQGSTPAARSATGAAGPPTQARPLKTSFTTLLLVAFYLVLVVVPWVLTCILENRLVPTSSATYEVNTGQITPGDQITAEKWMLAISVMNTAATLFALPVAIMVLQHVVAAFVQRRHTGQTLSARDLFALADLPWIQNLTGWPRRWGALAWVFLLLVMVVPFLVSGLVGTHEFQIAACTDVDYTLRGSPCYSSGFRYTAQTSSKIGSDPEPWLLNATTRKAVVDILKPQLIIDALEVSSPYEWPERGTSTTNFTTAFVVNTTDTGVLRYHAIRANSSVTCNVIDAAEFPPRCPGTDPLVGTFNTTAGDVARWCVPGSVSISPWAVVKDRLDITEEFFLTTKLANDSMVAKLLPEFTPRESTTHCVATSTRGYFELPNNHNNHTSGSLLTEWPTVENLTQNYNDRNYSGKVPLSITRTPTYAYLYTGSGPNTPGPLMTVMVSMLGDGSWLSRFISAQNATLEDAVVQANARQTMRRTCDEGFPLEALASTSRYRNSQICWYYSIYEEDWYRPATSNITALDDMNTAAFNWFGQFHYFNEMGPGLLKALNRAHIATFTEGVRLYGTGEYSLHSGGRDIYTTNGMYIARPFVGAAAKIAISAIIGLEVLGYAVLLGYIYSHGPTFGRRVSPLAAAAMGAQLAAQGVELPPLGHAIKDARKKALEKIESADGLIGVAERGSEYDITTTARRDAAGNRVRDAEETAATRSLRTSTDTPPAYQRHARGDEQTYEMHETDRQLSNEEPAPSYLPTTSRSQQPRMMLAVGAPGLVFRRAAKGVGPPSSRDSQA